MTALCYRSDSYPIAICNSSDIDPWCDPGDRRRGATLRREPAGNEIEMPDTGPHHDGGHHRRSLTRPADQRLMAIYASAATWDRSNLNRPTPHLENRRTETEVPKPILAILTSKVPCHARAPRADRCQRHTHMQHSCRRQPVDQGDTYDCPTTNRALQSQTSAHLRSRLTG
jgi:hypothetical protein